MLPLFYPPFAAADAVFLSSGSLLGLRQIWGLGNSLISCHTSSSVISSLRVRRRFLTRKGLSSRLNMREWLKSMIFSWALVMCSMGFVLGSTATLPEAGDTSDALGTESVDYWFVIAGGWVGWSAYYATVEFAA